MPQQPRIRSTTIVAVRRDGRAAMAGDGQVSLGQTILKDKAKKVRRIADGKVVVGFAGATADAFALLERLEAKLKEHRGSLSRAAVELAKDWRTDRALRRLEAMILAMDAQQTLLLSGTGDVIEPDDGIIAIGSGGMYALAAGRALLRSTELPAVEIARRSIEVAGEICVYTNGELVVEEAGIMSKLNSFTPREIVSELDRYIVGQHKAKRAIAIALRNRFRRQRVAPELREEIAPKNIIMIGPTGVGKTELARRLAKLAQAPFVKVEATKFTEVGYVGRDVESIVRDLVEQAIELVRKEQLEEVKTRAVQQAEERLVRLIARPKPREEPAPSPAQQQPFNPFGFALPKMPAQEPSIPESELSDVRKRLRAGELEERLVELDVEEAGPSLPLVSIFGGPGMEDLERKMGDMLGNLPGMKGQTRRRSISVREARRVLEEQEAGRLVDMDTVKRLAVERTEQSGIVFLDEIDKVASRGGGSHGPDVSREGVQRDLLPIVEGSTVSTKYGPVKTDHVLFIAAGAFHVSKVSDLIPELQGRFPVRVELESLTKQDFVRILTEPKNALTRQYRALLETEGLTVTFTDEAVEALAEYAAEANERAENIGARRLHTIMEALLDDLSFRASELTERDVVIDGEKVRATLDPIMANEDLSKYIL